MKKLALLTLVGVSVLHGMKFEEISRNGDVIVYSHKPPRHPNPTEVETRLPMSDTLAQAIHDAIHGKKVKGNPNVVRSFLGLEALWQDTFGLAPGYTAVENGNLEGLYEKANEFESNQLHVSVLEQNQIPDGHTTIATAELDALKSRQFGEEDVVLTQERHDALKAKADNAPGDGEKVITIADLEVLKHTQIPNGCVAVEEGELVELRNRQIPDEHEAVRSVDYARILEKAKRAPGEGQQVLSSDVLNVLRANQRTPESRIWTTAKAAGYPGAMAAGVLLALKYPEALNSAALFGVGLFGRLVSSLGSGE